jgi:hypothetical protein
MTISCPKCSQVIPGADIDLAHGRALCRLCSELVTLPSGGARPAALSRARTSSPPARRHKIAWREAENEGCWRALLRGPRWPGYVYLVVAFFCIANLIIDAPSGAIAFLIAIPTVACCALVGAKMLGGRGRYGLWMNADKFTVKGARRPLAIPTAAIERFRDNDDALNPSVQALTRDGRSVVLPLPLRNLENAWFVRDRLNTVLVDLRTPKTYRG